MLTIDPLQIAQKDLHQFMLGSVAPRPIAFVSTVDEHGNPNLAPYSFYNAFSSNPPIIVFSSNRRGENNTTKDTLHNIMATKEAVINVVNYDIVHQMAVCSIEYPSGVSEFSKSGLTPIPSELVAPPRVKESPVHLECKVQEVITLGDKGGAGHLIICHVVRMHIAQHIMDANGRIDPHKIDLVGRLGRSYYTRASGDSIFTLVQPFNAIGVGFQALPQSAQQSHILTGNNLGQLAALTALPTTTEVLQALDHLPVKHIVEQTTHTPQQRLDALHQVARHELAKGNTLLAAKIILLPEVLPA
jgi:flavin reductase (DIM6/NTAB) family NADH-FMN oxidoreductase RutF